MAKMRDYRNMDALDRSLYATLAYYNAIGFPLTLTELYARFIPPERSLGDVIAAYDSLPKTRSEQTIFHRIRYQKICAQKWHTMLRYAWWLQAAPFVRTLCASGSMALGNVEPQSDWDMFVIARQGRIYTARAGLLFLAWCMGRLRTKHMRIAPNRFCFNHIITTGSLAIQHRSIFTAHSLAWLIPMHDPENYMTRFGQANQWITRWVSHGGESQFIHRSIRRSAFLTAVRMFIELPLRTPLGTFVEYMLRTWMQRRIERDPATHAPGGRIVATDREIEFHPFSFEATVLSRYNTALNRLGLGQYAEHDSGLTK